MILTRGVYNQVVIHLEDIDFTNMPKIILTIKNDIDGDPIIIREYNKAEEKIETFTPEEIEKLRYTKNVKCGKAYYDFDAILEDGKRIKLSENEEVTVVKGVGDVNDAEYQNK